MDVGRAPLKFVVAGHRHPREGRGCGRDLQRPRSPDGRRVGPVRVRQVTDHQMEQRPAGAVARVHHARGGGRRARRVDPQVPERGETERGTPSRRGPELRRGGRTGTVGDLVVVGRVRPQALERDVVVEGRLSRLTIEEAGRARAPAGSLGQIERCRLGQGDHLAAVRGRDRTGRVGERRRRHRHRARRAPRDGHLRLGVVAELQPQLLRGGGGRQRRVGRRDTDGEAATKHQAADSDSAGHEGRTPRDDDALRLLLLTECSVRSGRHLAARLWVMLEHSTASLSCDSVPWRPLCRGDSLPLELRAPARYCPRPYGVTSTGQLIGRPSGFGVHAMTNL